MNGTPLLILECWQLSSLTDPPIASCITCRQGAKKVLHAFMANERTKSPHSYHHLNLKYNKSQARLLSSLFSKGSETCLRAHCGFFRMLCSVSTDRWPLIFTMARIMPFLLKLYNGHVHSLEIVL